MLTKKITALLSCLLLWHSNTLSAQDSLLLRDYRYVQQSSPWLTQRNAAALVRGLYNHESIAETELSFTHANGKLTDISGSPSVNNLQAGIESYYRINPRTVVFGAISYDNFSGSDMTGSVFMQQRLPFDIIEDSLTNSGRKHRDTYQLTGAFSYSFSPELSIGLRMDYTAGNYAKYKDLRHKNKLMDLLLTAGVVSNPYPGITIGADYTYHRRTESLEFNTYGKSDKVYKSLIDYGAMMGIVEQFGNEGYTDKSNEMPLFEDGHGVDIQLELCPLSSLSIFANTGYSHATGYYGSKSPFTITYTDHNRDIFTEQVRICYDKSTWKALLDIRYQTEKLQNRINTVRGLTNNYGATHYEYYDATETGDKKWRNLDIDYTMYLGIRHELPTWTLTAGYHWQQRDITAYLYPYYRQQQLRTSELTASVARNILLSKGIWNITAKGGYQKGSGDIYTDGTFVTPTGKQPQPATMEALLWRDYQYLTAPQYSIGMQVKYIFLFPGTKLCTHIRAAFDYRRASITDETPSGFHNPQRTTFTIATGHTF
jgi:hypothetical protein